MQKNSKSCGAVAFGQGSPGGCKQIVNTICFATDFTNPGQKDGYYKAYDDAEVIVNKSGIHSQYGFYRALKEYLLLPIEEAMNSDNAIIKGLSMIDKRLGKRRLKEISLNEGEHAFVKQLYKLRCEAENINCNI